MSHLKDVNKYLKQINVAKSKKNYQECIELYNFIGGLYSEVGAYDEACHYHEKALDICTTTGNRLGTALASRFIGEAKASLGDFNQAVTCIKKYLELAEQLKDKVEIQRALTTLGRVYLMQADESRESNRKIDRRTKELAREAEKRFQDALNLAETVRDQIDAKEHSQMISGLLINLAMIKDICGHYDQAVMKLHRAISICRSAKLKEDLFRCQLVLSGIYRQRNEVKLAVKISEDALMTAKSIGKKVLIVEALIERGLVRISQRDFKNAKRTFAQAYLEKSPNEDDNCKAIKLTKLTYLITTAHEEVCKDSTASSKRIKLCDKLGDLFVATCNLKLAIEFYRQALSNAKVCSKPKNELARILYSIAETYADDGQFGHALVCYQKELSYRNDNKEQCQSLIKIAHMHEYLEHEPEKVCEAYEKALDKADKDPKLMHNVLRYYVPYMRQKAYNLHRCRELSEELENLQSFKEVADEVELENYEESNELEDEITNIDDIITDDEDNDEVMLIGRRKAKSAGKFKQNEVGDTPLHEATIRGDFKRVKSLVAQGHDINPRDNAGWIPLHEACNHGHYEIAEFLIEHGADVNNRGLKGMSPLHDAATNGHYEIMRLLIKNGANVISLTDSGETVLSCLRDHKARNYNAMSNMERSEYKQMEAELLNVMDKCGYDLMSENIKKLGTRSNNLVESPLTVKPAERIRYEQLVSRQKISDPSVREYRDAIGTLKRKRPVAVRDDQNKRLSQPATVQSNFSTSIPTKHWLLSDDVIEEEDNSQEDNDDLVFLDQINSKKAKQRLEKQTPQQQKYDEVLIEDTDELKEEPVLQSLDDELDDLDGFNPDPPRPQSCVSLESENLQEISTKSTKSAAFDWTQPLVVNIEGKRLLLPVKDEHTTISELKKSIVDRYSILTQYRPRISLAPISDPDCLLSDSDICHDVIRGELVATVESWELESMETTYTENCRKFKRSPLNYIRIILKDFDRTSSKLNLSFSKLPKSHLDLIIGALVRRDFTHADLRNSPLLINGSTAHDVINSTVTTWSKLSRLELRCCGLLLSHFEQLCNSKARLPELQYIDVSVNLIAYQNKNDFASQVRKLCEQVCCGKLLRLDIRRNFLSFVKSIVNQSTAEAKTSECTRGASASQLDGKKNMTSVDISKELELSNIEILLDDQYDYTVHHT